MQRERIGRRDWLRSTAAMAVGASLGWFGELAAQAASDPARKRSCIVLWMAGGPSQMDTFDPKPGTPNGGPVAEIETSVPDIRISENLPLVAKQVQHLAILRSMQTREGDHGRATAHLHTGYLPQGPIRFPSLGALVAHELADAQADLPGFVSVGSAVQPSVAAGFLGPQHAPLVVGGPGGRGDGPDPGAGGALRVEDLSTSISSSRWDERFKLLREMESPFLESRPGPGAASHVTAYDRAARLRSPAATRAFDLNEETATTRERYGRGTFG